MILRLIVNSRFGKSAREASALIAVSMLAFGCRTTATRPANQEFHFESWSEGDLVGRRVTTEHFEIYSTLLDSEFERNVPSLLESAYSAYSKMAPGHAPARPMQVYLFNSRTGWNIYSRAHYPVRYETYARIHVGGFSEGESAVIYYFGRNTTLAALLHEGWHQYVASCLASEPPAWLNEGIACYFESGEARKNNTLVFPERSTLRANGLRLAIYNNRLLSLREVLSINAGDVLLQNDSSLTKSYYGQVWALVAFLRDGFGGRYSADFQKLLTDLSTDAYRIRESATRLSEIESSTTSPAIAAFEQYFHISADAMDSQYRDFLRIVTTTP